MKDYEIQVWLWPKKNRESAVEQWDERSPLSVLRRYDSLSGWELVEIIGPYGGIVHCDIQAAATILDWMDEGSRVSCKFLKRDEEGRILISFDRDI